jgi:hypothetical protein
MSRLVNTIDSAAQQSTGIFLTSELERMDQRLNKPLVAYKYTRDLPFRSDISITDAVSSFINTDFSSVGGANPVGKNWMGVKGTAIADVNVVNTPTRNSLHIWAHQLSYTIFELMESQKVGRPIDEQKHEGLILKWNMDADEQAYIGDTEVNVPGLLNLPSVTPVAAPAPWTATTDPDVIVQDINLVLSDAWVRSGYAICPSKVGMAPELFSLLVSKKVSSAGNMSLLEYIKVNCIAYQENGEKLDVVAMKWASNRGVAGSHRLIAYTQDEQYVRFPVVPLMNTPVDYHGLQQSTVYYGKLGQVETPYSNTISYLDIPVS